MRFTLLANLATILVMKAISIAVTPALLVIWCSATFAAEADPLAVGVAGHAFDHLGSIGEQADAAVASGANIIYVTGVGGAGYEGLPPVEQLHALHEKSASYIRHAKETGVRLAIGYVCATSIVNLAAFDKNWSKEFRGHFSSTPDHWLQQSRDGKPLPSWYGGQYAQACMNNPDWRAYEKQIVEMQLRAGCDGIFFDNPTVHPNGCYCEHCMKRFAAKMQREEKDLKLSEPGTIDMLRELPAKYPQQFLKFRAEIAADFLREIRTFARTINPKALITCNNSLNSPEVFFSQCRTYGYNIHALSQAEDFIVVEDQAAQPRTLASGATIEYGPVYEMLHAISHGKPVVAVTIADGDYHTPPNLMRLAMAEAAAHRSSYLSWPTWPEAQRLKMAGAVKPEADFLRQHADLLNETQPLADVAVYMPFPRWLATPKCWALDVCRTLSRKNVQFKVLGEESLPALLEHDQPKLLIAESAGTLSPTEKATLDQFTRDGGRIIWSSAKNWPADLQAALPHPAVVVEGPPGVRAVAFLKDGKTVVHLLNLNIARLSSFEDRVTPAENVKLRIRCRAIGPKSVQALTADEDGSHGELPFHAAPQKDGAVVEVTVPLLRVATILVIH